MRSPVTLALFCLLAIGTAPVNLAQQTVPLRAAKSSGLLSRAHAHNDYEHPRPLRDALDHGFGSVEADIWLVNGKLLVAHDRDKVKPERTLEALYLDPLRERSRKNGGRVHGGGAEFTLLIDIKSDAEKTYMALREVLKSYADILTEFRTNQTRTNAVTVIISGNRPRQVMARESARYAAYDGRLPDLDSNASPHLIPLISDNWQSHIKWPGVGAMPDDEKRKLKEVVEKAHQQGRKVRFWATPDRIEVWRELLDAGVDLINTDDLSGLEEFLRGRAGSQPSK